MSFSFAGLPGSACPKCGSLGFARYDLDLQCVDCGHGDVPADRLRDPPDEWLEANWSVDHGGLRWSAMRKPLGFAPDAARRCWVTKWLSLEIDSANAKPGSKPPSPLHVPLTNRVFAWLVNRTALLVDSDSRHLERMLDLASIASRCVEAGLADVEMLDPANWPRLDDRDYDPFSRLAVAYNAVRLASLDWDDSRLWVDSSLWVSYELDGEPRTEEPVKAQPPMREEHNQQPAQYSRLTKEEKKVKGNSLF